MQLAGMQQTRCPLLEKRCRMKHPQIWPKISHIPGIQVDDRWIQPPRMTNRYLLSLTNQKTISVKDMFHFMSFSFYVLLNPIHSEMEIDLVYMLLNLQRINKSSKATWKLTLYICFEEVTIQVLSNNIDKYLNIMILRKNVTHQCCYILT